MRVEPQVGNRKEPDSEEHNAKAQPKPLREEISRITVHFGARLQGGRSRHFFVGISLRRRTTAARRVDERWNVRGSFPGERNPRALCHHGCNPGCFIRRMLAHASSHTKLSNHRNHGK